jgi:Fe2+ or Zn2+ uptake regulation protein
MATKIYDAGNIFLIDDTEVYITPLKIKYLRQVMDIFDNKLKPSKDQEQIMESIMECVAVSMKQYYPILKTIEDVEDSVDLPTAYKILEIGAGIKLAKESNQEKEEVRAEDLEADNDWNTFDLAKLESEAFLLGIWKDYEELETSLSMPELMETLRAKRESEYAERKFLAAIQGIDIEKNNDSNAWEKMKARVFSRGKTENPNDIVAFQGANAQKAGFGIGLGLSYERID